MVEAIVVVTFAVVAGWWFFTRPEKKELPPATGVVVEPPKGGDTIQTPWGPITLPSDKELNKLTKVKIEEVGREHGVELDRRKTKANMIADLKEAVK